MVERIDATPEYVESERVGRYKELQLSTRAFVDALIPGPGHGIWSAVSPPP